MRVAAGGAPPLSPTAGVSAVPSGPQDCRAQPTRLAKSPLLTSDPHGTSSEARASAMSSAQPDPAAAHRPTRVAQRRLAQANWAAGMSRLSVMVWPSGVIVSPRCPHSSKAHCTIEKNRALSYIGAQRGGGKGARWWANG